jgi:hypothetical protein
MRSNRVCAVYPFQDRVEIHVPGKRRLFGKDLPDKTLTFTWGEVTRVIAFKRDCWIVDSIRFVFELNGTQTIEVWEEMKGWEALVDAVPVYLPGALSQKEWWERVVSPTFELCRTEIYPRP